MISIEQIFIGAAIFLFLSILANKISEKYGIPALLLFLFVGMLASGSTILQGGDVLLVLLNEASASKINAVLGAAPAARAD